MHLADLTFSPRPASADDLDRLVEIDKRVQTAPWNRTHFEAELDKPWSVLWVLSDDETDETIAGYLVGRLDGSESAHLINIATDLPYRGMGYAKKLLGAFVSEALRRECVRIVLEVRRSNMPAIQLYQRLKFTIMQIRRGFYSDGEDAYVMELALDGSGAATLLENLEPQGNA